MITIDETTCMIESFLAFALLWYILIRLYPTFRLDLFRQRMFAVRDQLFDYAAEGNIDFSHPAYKLLRNTMNAYLRYGHRLTFLQLLLTLLHWRILGDQPTLDKYKRLQGAIDGISDPEVRRTMEAFHSKAMRLVLNHLVNGSYLLRILIGVFLLRTLVTDGITNLHQAFLSSTGVVVNKLVDLRLVEEEAARRYVAC